MHHSLLMLQCIADEANSNKPLYRKLCSVLFPQLFYSLSIMISFKNFEGKLPVTCSHIEG